jgi:hypothetical protein
MPISQQVTLDLTSSSYRDNCDRLRYLEQKQRELCALSQNILTVSGLPEHSSTRSLTCSNPHALLHSLAEMLRRSVLLLLTNLHAYSPAYSFVLVLLSLSQAYSLAYSSVLVLLALSQAYSLTYSFVHIFTWPLTRFLFRSRVHSPFDKLTGLFVNLCFRQSLQLSSQKYNVPSSQH